MTRLAPESDLARTHVQDAMHRASSPARPRRRCGSSHGSSRRTGSTPSWSRTTTRTSRPVSGASSPTSKSSPGWRRQPPKRPPGARPSCRHASSLRTTRLPMRCSSWQSTASLICSSPTRRAVVQSESSRPSTSPRPCRASGSRDPSSRQGAGSAAARAAGRRRCTPSARRRSARRGGRARPGAGSGRGRGRARTGRRRRPRSRSPRSGRRSRRAAGRSRSATASS